jgi:hypothetical protein
VSGRGIASPATLTRQYRSARSIAKSISAYVWGDGIRLSWSAAKFHLQDSPS